MKVSKEKIFDVIVRSFFVFVLVYYTWFITKEIDRNLFHEEAVKQGHARFLYNEMGESIWMWNDACGK